MGVFKDLLKSLIRAWLYALLTWFVTKGWVSKEDADSWLDPMTATILGAVGFVAVYLWSARDKFKSWLFGVLAREAPANVSPKVIKQRIKRMPRKKAIQKVLEANALPESAERG